jgi:hypothetical protein
VTERDEEEVMDPDEVVMFFWTKTPAVRERREQEAEDRKREEVSVLPAWTVAGERGSSLVFLVTTDPASALSFLFRILKIFRYLTCPARAVLTSSL